MSRIAASHRRRAAPLAAVVTAVLIGGCGASAPQPERASSRTMSSGQATVAAPTGKPVLRMTGDVQNTNAHGRLALDMKGIETLGVERVELYEPFKRKAMTFRAVPLRKVIDLAAPTGRAETLHSVALNDFVVDIPVDVARRDGVYLATSNGDGSPIAIKDGGPIRVVFRDGTEDADVDNYWIWSLARMDLR